MLEADSCSSTSRPPVSTRSLRSNSIGSSSTLSRDLGITVVIVTHELPSIFLVADHCIVLDKAAKGIVAQGDPRKLSDASEIPFVHNFFTRSCPVRPQIKEGNTMAVEKLRATWPVHRRNTDRGPCNGGALHSTDEEP